MAVPAGADRLLEEDNPLPGLGEQVLPLGSPSRNLCRVLKGQGIRFQRRSLTPILDWAQQAPAAGVAPATYQRIALALQDDHVQKNQQICCVARATCACCPVRG